MSSGMSLSRRRISTKSEVIWRIEGRDEELRREEVENVDGEDKGDKEWMPIDLARWQM